MTLPQNTAERWAASHLALPMNGDGFESCILDHSRICFTGGDAIPNYSQLAPWAHNLITIVGQSGMHCVKPNYGGLTPSPYQVIPETGDGYSHWLGQGCYYNGMLYVTSPVVSGAGTTVRTDLCAFTVEDNQDPVYSTYSTLPKNWAAGLFYDPADGYVYWFGNSADATDGWTGLDGYVARQPIGTIMTPSSWTFWDGAGWNDSPAAAAPFFTSAANGGLESVYTAWRDESGWHIICRYGGGWGSHNGHNVISRWDNANLTSGSWSQSDIVMDIDSGAYICFYHRTIGKITYNKSMSPMTWIDYSG